MSSKTDLRSAERMNHQFRFQPIKYLVPVKISDPTVIIHLLFPGPPLKRKTAQNENRNDIQQKTVAMLVNNKQKTVSSNCLCRNIRKTI